MEKFHGSNSKRGKKKGATNSGYHRPKVASLRGLLEKKQRYRKMGLDNKRLDGKSVGSYNLGV